MTWTGIAVLTVVGLVILMIAARARGLTIWTQNCLAGILFF